ncbi:hypothetical protein HY635_01740 [Candidatus Uhrbacteria bacterium]|nr:hypothetical protein [Candidatus Uhrbacteria bacterium]
MPCSLFISGPHGGGKSTLSKRLAAMDQRFVENDFDIDFTVDFPNIASLSPFERCLIRLYHRMFIASYAETLAAKHPGACIVTNRTMYDSEAYIHVYRDVGWITVEELRKLDLVLSNVSVRPYAVVLNPPVAVILQHLKKRRSQGTRSVRDDVFANEDSESFLTLLHAHFEKFKTNDHVLYLEDDSDASLQRIIHWVEQHLIVKA